MNRLFFFVALVVGSSLAGPAAFAQAKPGRNEQQARRFLFCMNINQFFYEYLQKNDPQNPGLAGFRDSRFHYRLAATLLSDGEFVTKEAENTLQDVMHILEKDQAEKTAQIHDEAKSCVQTFKNEVVPIIQQAGAAK
jgi:hypothetical protein